MQPKRELVCNTPDPLHAVQRFGLRPRASHKRSGWKVAGLGKPQWGAQR